MRPGEHSPRVVAPGAWVKDLVGGQAMSTKRKVHETITSAKDAQQTTRHPHAGPDGANRAMSSSRMRTRDLLIAIIREGKARPVTPR